MIISLQMRSGHIVNARTEDPASVFIVKNNEQFITAFSETPFEYRLVNPHEMKAGSYPVQNENGQLLAVYETAQGEIIDFFAANHDFLLIEQGREELVSYAMRPVVFLQASQHAGLADGEHRVEIDDRNAEPRR